MLLHTMISLKSYTPSSALRSLPITLSHSDRHRGPVIRPSRLDEARRPYMDATLTPLLRHMVCSPFLGPAIMEIYPCVCSGNGSTGSPSIGTYFAQVAKNSAGVRRLGGTRSEGDRVAYFPYGPERSLLGHTRGGYPARTRRRPPAGLPVRRRPRPGRDAGTTGACRQLSRATGGRRRRASGPASSGSWPTCSTR
jgi:hypothetical protein